MHTEFHIFMCMVIMFVFIQCTINPITPEVAQVFTFLGKNQETLHGM
jgi:hypothetical protein